jgi:DNA-binding FadR family transcriptional regulator
LDTQWTEAAIFRLPARTRRRASLAEEIADLLRRRIVSGDLAPDRKLPSMRRLAHLFGVSIPTIEGAIRVLVAIGLVRVSRGVGTFITQPKAEAVLLNYAWREASAHELILLRTTIDERATPLVAAMVARGPWNRLPKTLGDISFFAQERSVRRVGDPRSFLRADATFHRTVLRSVRGAEIGATLYERIAARGFDILMPVADVQAADAELDALHLDSAAAIIDGEVARATRLARAIARRELASLGQGLG